MTRPSEPSAEVPCEGTVRSAEVMERRCRVTLLFSDLCDYTALSEASDPEEVDAIRRRLAALASSVIEKHHGAVNQFVGDAILAVFGFPEADEQDVRHALDAALELHEQARTLEWERPLPSAFRFRMHSGVHAGLVFARKGSPLHGEYELAGDAVNTASRLCSAAGRDEVLVSESTLRGVEPFFEALAVSPLRLKGKQQRVAAFRILQRSGVETRFQARSRIGLTPFIGRNDELELLQASLSEACRSRCQLLCLVGDAGLGKTRLLDELKHRATLGGVRTQRGSCESYGGVAPLRPFLQILRELLPSVAEAPLEQRILAVERGLERIDDALRAHLNVFLDLLSIKPWASQVGMDERQSAVIFAVVDLLKACAKQAPLLLIVDDWQWADGASVQVLARLLRTAQELPLCVVIGARNLTGDDPVLAHAPTLWLKPFSEAESLQAAHLLVDGRLQASVLLGIHRRSGGNPLFLEELCSGLKAGLSLAEDAQECGVPTTVHALIRARVERLPAELSRLLAVASVIGNEFPGWLLERAFDAPDAALLLGKLTLLGLLHASEVDGDFRFKHGLTRDVVYETVRFAERRKLHGAVASAIEARHANTGLADHYEALAYHYAGALEFRRAFGFAEQAGDKAAATAALDRARSHYAAAIAHIDELAPNVELRRRWISIVAKWSAACVFDPTREQLRVLARAAAYAQDLEDFEALAVAEHWMGWINYALGDQGTAILHLSRSLELAQRAHKTRLTAQLLVNIGQSYAASGQYQLALDHLDRGIVLKRTFTPMGVGTAYALGCRALVHGDRGDFGAAYLEVQEGLDIIRGTGNALEGSLLTILGMVQLWQGRWQEALITAARGRETGERVNGPYVLALCQSIAGYARWRLERTPAALASLRSSVEWLERREIQLYLSFCYGHLARALLEAGEHDAAVEQAGRALARARGGDPLGESMAHRVLAYASACGGATQDARDHCDKARRSALQRGSPRELALTELALADLEAAWGDGVTARARLEQAASAFEGFRMHWHSAEATRILQNVR